MLMRLRYLPLPGLIDFQAKYCAVIAVTSVHEVDWDALDGHDKLP